MQATYSILRNETLHGGHNRLASVTYTIRYNDNAAFTPTHEIYEIGNAASVLLYNPSAGTVLLTRQFRLPAALNGHPEGMLLETCAGKLNDKSPEETVRAEALQELGYRLGDIFPVQDIYPSPGSLVEKLHLFVAPYEPHMKVASGGGLPEENEHVEVVEMAFSEIMALLGRGEIADAKTIILLQHLAHSGRMGE